MPGILATESELCLNRNLLGQALLILEEEGIPVPQGKGKPRKIVIPKTHRLKTLRIGIIEYQARDVNRFHPRPRPSIFWRRPGIRLPSPKVTSLR